MEKLNLSPKEIHSINPSIIYGRLSGFGQVESKYKERAGHDINYLALTGVLSKFRRVDKGEPAAPANFLADFASGSLHLFNQVLQALYLKTPNTVIDCSLAHSTMYLSQLELLKEITYGPINRHKSKLNVPKPSFTHPHEMIFTDFDGNLFTPLPGTKFHEKIMIQHFNDEEGESAQKYGEIMQLAFVGMKIEQIEKEYGPMNRIAKYDDVIEKRYSNGNIPNVFDQEYKVREPKQGAAQELIGKL